MIGQPNITEKIINFLADLGNAMDYPKLFGQMLSWDRHIYLNEREKMRAKMRRERRRIKQALWRLEKTAMITYNKKQNRYILTPSGWLKYIHYYNKRNTKRPKDEGIEKYFIIFDIPEKYRRFRNLFRQCLKNLGCHMEQKSVFQTNDQEVFKFAQKIVSNCDLDGHVKFIEARKIF